MGRRFCGGVCGGFLGGIRVIRCGLLLSVLSGQIRITGSYQGVRPHADEHDGTRNDEGTRKGGEDEYDASHGGAHGGKEPLVR